MCLCVGADYVNLIACAELAYAACTALENINVGQTAARRLKLRRDLTNLKRGAKESMISYIMRGKQIGTSLRAIDESVSDANLIDSILSSLPDEYATKVDMLIILGETDLLKFQNQLLQAKAAIIKREVNTGQVVFFASVCRPKQVCLYCGRKGLTREKCWFVNGLPPHLQNKHQKSNEQEENIALCIGKGKNCSEILLKSCRIIDSGTTAHVCSQDELLSEVTDNRKTQKIYVGNGHATTTCTEDRDGLTKHIQMQNAMLCPK